MVAVNSILSKQTGVFFRYRYTDSKGTGGLFEGETVPGVPKHFLNGGVMWVSPLYVKVLVFSNYVGSQYENFSNTRKISDYWTTNLATIWEPFQKRGLLSLAINNLWRRESCSCKVRFFDPRIPALGSDEKGRREANFLSGEAY